MPGKYWYAAMSFVYGAGGNDRRRRAAASGAAQLESSQAQQGLAALAEAATTYSIGGATKDESDQDAIMAQGHVAAILGNGWEVGAVTDPKTGNPKLAPKPVDVPAAGHGRRPVHPVVPRWLGPGGAGQGGQRRPRARSGSSTSPTPPARRRWPSSRSRTRPRC